MKKKIVYKKIEQIHQVKDCAQLELLYRTNASLKNEKINVENLKNVWDKSVKVEENGYYWNKTPIFLSGTNIKNTKPTVVELFSGCGGTSYGFKMADYEIVLGLDIHMPSIQTFKKNHPNAAAILGDVRKIGPEIILDYLKGKKIDVLIAGVPCQGFSLNNRKRHIEDERNFLYKEFIRFLKVLKPTAVVLENVVGMKSTKNGEFVKTIEQEIALNGDMKVKSEILFAPDYGVPQKRSRLVFIGVKGNKSFDFSHIEKTHGPGHKLPYVTVGNAISDLPRLNAGESDKRYSSKPYSEYQKLMRIESNGLVFNHEAPNHPESTIQKIRDTKPGQPMYPKFKQRIRLAWDILSPTQVSGGIRPQFQFGHPADNRGLSIRERCRLQSFPDNFYVTGGIVQGRVQTGNAVPPLLAKAIAISLKKYI
jgi:DNA (cytosine-5)-methyltransferase 1